MVYARRDMLRVVFRELLEKIKAFEERQFSGQRGGDVAPKLEPMNEGGGTALLKMVRYDTASDVCRLVLVLVTLGLADWLVSLTGCSESR